MSPGNSSCDKKSLTKTKNQRVRSTMSRRTPEDEQDHNGMWGECCHATLGTLPDKGWALTPDKEARQKS